MSRRHLLSVWVFSGSLWIRVGRSSQGHTTLCTDHHFTAYAYVENIIVHKTQSVATTHTQQLAVQRSVSLRTHMCVVFACISVYIRCRESSSSISLWSWCPTHSERHIAPHKHNNRFDCCCCCCGCRAQNTTERLVELCSLWRWVSDFPCFISSRVCVGGFAVCVCQCKQCNLFSRDGGVGEKRWN